MNAIVKHTERQLALIKRTVAAGLSDDEFNMFVELANRNRLDPFRGQVSPIVFNAKNADKRRVALVVGIDGLRTIADRLETYAPDEAKPEYTIDESAKSPANPHGIIDCTVYVYKERKGRWFRVPGTARWDEFCPVTEEWADDGTGRRRPTGKKTPGGKWGDMPFHMLAIAAERQALRKGWPDSFADLYAPEEIERGIVDVDASAAVAKLEKDKRLAATGGRGLMFQFDPQGAIEKIPMGQVHSRLDEFVRDAGPAKRLEWFMEANQAALREFWAESKDEALDIKERADARLASLQAEEGEAA